MVPLSPIRCVLLSAALVVALALFSPGAAGAAQTQEGPTGSAAVSREGGAPAVPAQAWMLMDLRSGEYLAGKRASMRLPMGSTDKIMVALVVLEKVAAGEADLDDEVTVSENAAAFAIPAYSNVGLLPGDVLSVRELLMATLIPSGNDAAYALAEHFGGVEHFVEEMNRRARDLKLEDTRFRNPTGLDAAGQYSSARDLATMARAALGHSLFREAVKTEYATVATQDRQIELVSTNELLSLYPPATGVKTGNTPAAGPCLVASAASGDESYLSVVLGDENRFADSMLLLQHAFDNYDRRALAVEGQRYATVQLPYRRGKTVDLVAKKSVSDLVDENSRIEREVRVTDELPAHADPGTKLGEIVVEVDGETVGSSPLLAREGYDRASLWERVSYVVSGIGR